MKRKIGKFVITISATIMLMSSLTVLASDDIAYGVDISGLSQLEGQGVSYVDDEGNVDDPLKLLVEKGVDSVRIRAFVNPDSSFQWTKDSGETCNLGYCDTAGVIYTAQRAMDLGLDIDLVFHYSDHFADPQYQDIPEQWADATAEELTTYIYDYTYYLMNRLAQEGIYPKWVEVGNEVNGGILFPYGSSTTNFEQLTAYLNAGYDAVKAVSPNSKVVTHLANLGNYSYISVSDFTWFFDNFITTYGGKTDVIGMSYYPYWLGYDIDGAELTLCNVAARYDKEVMICETGESELDPDGTYELLRKEINALAAVPDGKGIGIFYWEPEINSSVVPDSYALGATEVVSTNTLHFTSALDAYSLEPEFLSDENYFAIYNLNSEKSLNVCSGSCDNSVNIEQYTFDDWESQEWQFVEVEDGYYKIVNKNSGKVLDIEALSTSEGASCIQYEYNAGWNQMWSIEDDGTAYKIKNRLSGLYLGILDSSSNDGAWCVQMMDDDTNNVKWYLLVTE